MRFLLPPCLALLWLAAAQAGEPKPIAVTVGQEFKVTLQYRLASGYQWQLAKPPEATLVKLLSSEYRRSDAKLAGAGGDMVWTFRALAAGKAEMGFSYVRPWERGVKPAQTTNFVVFIQTAQEPGNRQEPKPGN